MPDNTKLHNSLDLLEQAICEDYAGRIALVSSFGAESVVLLDMVAHIRPATPVLFNETGMLFAETLNYQREVAEFLGLTNIYRIRPNAAELRVKDPESELHMHNVEACCNLRKTQPLKRALQPYAAWITGRKRFQAATRSSLKPTEWDEAGRFKLNPLYDWNVEDLADYIDKNDLPRHPLTSKGYKSIGCAPCTTPVADGEDARAGRWRGSEKTECGIHYVNGKVVRSRIIEARS